MATQTPLYVIREKVGEKQLYWLPHFKMYSADIDNAPKYEHNEILDAVAQYIDEKCHIEGAEFTVIVVRAAQD